MQTLILMRNSLDPNSFERHEVESALDYLATQFKTFPDTARLYHNYVAQSCDVTPNTDEQIERLKTLDGTIYCVVYPAGIEWIIIGIVAVIAIAAAAYLLTVPQITDATKAQAPSSPNNNLSGRQNQARPNARIPDIYGLVRSTPDLLTVPYKIFTDLSVEVEISYMCIGRGYYDVSDVKEGDTLVSQILGASVEVYNPFTSPNSGSPVLQIGDAIAEALLSVQQVSGVNGQSLPPPNLGVYTWTTNKVQAQPNDANTMQIKSSSGIPSMYDLAAPGDSIQLTGFAPGGLDLNGIYTVAGVAPYLPVSNDGHRAVGNQFIKFWQPQFVNPNWSSIGIGTAATTLTLTNLTNAANQWVGPFTIDMPELTTIIANFVALGGLYTIDGSSGVQSAVDIDLELEITPIDANGNPTGAAELFQTTLSGSSVKQEQVAITLYAVPTIPGRQSVRAHRLTNHDYTFSGQTIEEIKLRDLYGAAPVTETDFGNVTTVYAKSLGTTQALSVKERKLNMFATRKLQLRLTGTTFDSAWTATQSADEIIAAIALDPFNGNRPVAELDLDNIYSTIAAVKAYFGTAEAGQFNYTFDKAEVSYEDMIKSVATSVFCTPYRRGSVLTLAFEKATPDSSILFNHRNKIPKSETRSIAFGNQNDFDGVWLNYIDPDDGAKLTYYIPLDQSSVNPKKIDTIGVTSFLQAYFLAWRAWNKIRYQNVAINFTGMQEANKLVVTERILVADNTQQATQDGEIWEQHGLELTLSQDAVFTAGSGTLDLINNGGGIDNQLWSPASLSINGATYYKIRARIRPIDVAWLWEGACFYKTAAHDFSGSFVKYAPQPSGYAANVWCIAEWDMSSLTIGGTDWITSIITRFRLDFTDLAPEHFEVDWIEIVDVNNNAIVSYDFIGSSQGWTGINNVTVTLTNQQAYTIFIQHYDGTIESIGVNAGSAPNKVILSTAPRLPLALNDDNYSFPTYVIVGSTAPRSLACLLTEKTPQDNYTVDVTAANYDDRFYANDTDHINLLV